MNAAGLVHEGASRRPYPSPTAPLTKGCNTPSEGYRDVKFRRPRQQLDSDLQRHDHVAHRLFYSDHYFRLAEPDRFSVKKDSPFDGSGGTGAVGALNEGRDRDTVVWRKSLLWVALGKVGRKCRPFLRPIVGGTTAMLRHLEDLSVGTLKDNYALCVPLPLLFERRNTLSPSGVELLHAIAQRIRYLPYDVHFEVDDSQNIPQAVLLAEQFTHEEVVHPARLAVGIRQSVQPWHASVWGRSGSSSVVEFHRCLPQTSLSEQPEKPSRSSLIPVDGFSAAR